KIDVKHTPMTSTGRLFQLSRRADRQNFRRVFILIICSLSVLPSRALKTVNGQSPSVSSHALPVRLVLLRAGDSVPVVFDHVTEVVYDLPMAQGQYFRISLVGAPAATAVVLK